MDKEYFNFLKDAYTGGLCDEYRDEIRKCHEDKLQLARLAMRQQSIPYIATKMNDGVITRDYLMKSFGDFLNGFVLKDCDDVPDYTYAWYVDYDYDNDLVIDVDVVHISWTVGASVIVQQTKSPVLYISNRSDVHLVCDGYNHPKIYLFDKAKVTIEDLACDSNVVVYKYSNECKVEQGKFCIGDVKEFEKELRI